MNNRTVLVTGACGGIGSAVVIKLLDSGFSVVGLDRTDNGFASPCYTFLKTDVTSPDSVKEAYAAVCQLTDSLFGIVNTAGIVFMGSLIEEDAELMQRILDVNVAGMARVIRVFFPLIEKERGRIVNFSSEYGVFCSIPFHGFYTASKHAVECCNDSLRRELASLGIRVIAIRPGAVDTPMTAGTVPQFERLLETSVHFKEAYRKLYPLMAGATKHPTPPDRIAEKVAEALTVSRPKRYYNLHQDLRVKLLSLLPAGMVDLIFRLFF